MNALTKWDPFKEMEDLQGRFAKFLGLPQARIPNGEQEQMIIAEWSPSVDIIEEEKEYLVEADLPDTRSRKFPDRRMNSVLLLLLFPTALSAAAFSDADWSPLGSGMDGPVYALAVDGTNLYAGGSFTNAAGVLVNRIAKWNGSAWSALGAGMSGPVYALAMNGNNLYAGGSFTNAGGVHASRIAKWNGSAWSALGAGMDGPVYAVAADESYLYAGGSFTTADGVVVNNIARWQGSWSALRNPGPDGLIPGADGSVQALAFVTGGLGVAGGFFNAGGHPNYGVVLWSGFFWSSIDSGLGVTDALANAGTGFYAGGAFTVTRNNSTLKNIAKWNGSAWQTLIYYRYAPADAVYALAMSGPNLYLGGAFMTVTVGPLIVNHIVCFSETTSGWSALGSGVNNTVRALAADGAGSLFVGGDFTIAGTNSLCRYIARANLSGSVSGGTFGGAIFSPVSGFSCTFSNGTIGNTYRIQARPSLATGIWTDLTNFTYAGPVTITDPEAVHTTNRFYRAIYP